MGFKVPKLCDLAPKKLSWSRGYQCVADAALLEHKVRYPRQQQHVEPGARPPLEVVNLEPKYSGHAAQPE